MKLHTLLVASALVALGVGSSQAAVTNSFIRISGSTAFRNSAQQAALDYLNSISYVGTALSTGHATYAYTGTSGLQKAGAANFYAAVDANGDTLEIQSNFTGSVHGLISAQAHSTTGAGAVAFIDAASTGTTGGTSGLSVGTTNQAVDVAFSDIYAETPNKWLNSTGTFSISNLSAVSGTGIGSNGIVGVIPFEYITGKNNTFTSGYKLTNITTPQAASVLLNGAPSASYTTTGRLFSTNSSDSADTIFAIGRDVDSGTRGSALATSGLLFLSDNSSNTGSGEYYINQVGTTFKLTSVTVLAGGSGYASTDTIAINDNALTNTAAGLYVNGAAGSGATATLTVSSGVITAVTVTASGSKYTNPSYKITTSGGTGASLQLNLTIDSHVSFPAYTGPFTSVAYAAGHEGYNSGSLVAEALSAVSDSTKNHYIAYVGVSDANTATGNSFNPAVALTYNGVSYSAANVENGTYAFWGYEHIYFATNVTTGQKTYINNYAAKVVADTTSTTGAVPLSSMNAFRMSVGPNTSLSTVKQQTNDGGAIVFSSTANPTIPAITQ